MHDPALAITRSAIAAMMAGACALTTSTTVRASETCPICTLPDPVHPTQKEPALNEAGGFDIHFGFVSFAPAVANKTFSATGTPSTGAPRSFSATGRDLGYAHPRTYGGELGVDYLRRYVRVGVAFGLSGVRSDVAAASGPDVELAAGGTLSMFHFGIGGALLLPLGRARLGIGGLFGAYYLWMPVRGFDTTCSGTRCSKPTASTWIGMVQPRLSFDVALTADDATGALSLGGFFGLDAGSAVAPCWGLTLSIHTAQRSLAP
jgi:hypothetical protein